ncbi:cation diffusion facilitator family transporter [Nonomuraea gerenzanensis]|uniref:Cobalt-zinc-cadmium resistance protein n=1 Tax=Nonomuraea gerenzanensis TaxID=93944 RepID=A0A1M4E8H8_9ACTN|nr:cation diffusion facilitator family transporter [Nonomuraea gerenzanensis]UBU17308.1 cation diffusion facilitator family transporter [Nonomuraea gerenzanensis]SBO95054.1 Cobalt-zinc-cadmium resistance protein [Nonomuraea gerenzanensis]
MSDQHRRSSDHEDGHEHGHGHGHGQPGEERRRGVGAVLGRIAHALAPHSHDTSDKTDSALEASNRGMRVLGISFAVLMLTAAVQAVIVYASGSVALLGDTLHNLADALTAVPLAIAFSLGRRAANRRFTYGYGRAEDLAGIVIVLLITASAALAGYEAVRRLLDPQEIQAVGWVAGAAVIGFAGNEWVARYRIKVGKEIGSAALVADGLHARTDGFTSLAVLLGAGGAALGFPVADPVVGLLITIAICFVLRDAAREIYHRLMDAVDPVLVDDAERILATVEGVRRVESVRLRWIGHALHAEVEILVDHDMSVVAAHKVAVEAEHRLIHDLPRLRAATVHTDPDGPDGADHHSPLSTHRTP